MFIKAFSPDHFDTHGEPTSEILKISSRGLELGAIKQANLFKKIIENYTLSRDKTAVHTIAMTASDNYGFNRNGDGWTRENLLRDHPTFVKNAKVFRHHRNSPDDPSYGVVKASMYNEDMDRVELLLELDNEKCSEELSLLEKEGSFPVSMACRIKFDVCSICENRAKTAAEYCGHVKKSLGQILEDGRMVGVDNPDSTFFDISRVIRPADRVAYTLRKAASNEVVSGAEFAKELGYSLPFDLLVESMPKNAAERMEILSKLSDMEKRIEGVMKAHSEVPNPLEESDKGSKNLAKKLSAYTTSFYAPQVMRSLADNQVMLSANEYVTMMTGSEPDPKIASEVSVALKDIFSQSFDMAEEITKTSGYESCDLPVTGRIADICRDLAAFRRLDTRTSVARSKRAETTPESVTTNPNARKIAQEYVKYQLETLRQIKQSCDPQEFKNKLFLSIMFNAVQ